MFLYLLWLAAALFAFLAWINTKLIQEELTDLKKSFPPGGGIGPSVTNDVKDGKSVQGQTS